MKYLKLFNESFKEEDIHAICKRHNIKNFTINSDNSIDVDDDVRLNYFGLTELPLKFGVVTGSFFCSYNKLTSLEGCPKKVGGGFDCENNLLTSLTGCPIEVGDIFYCSENNLTSLEGSPSKINGDFDCAKNKLKSLKGSPKEIAGYFACNENKLTSLIGCPIEVGVGFYLHENELTTLEGCPLSNYFECWGNPVYEIYRLFPEHQSFIDSLDYNYFRGGNKINKIRLTQALQEFGEKCPDKIRGYIWE